MRAKAGTCQSTVAFFPVICPGRIMTSLRCQPNQVRKFGCLHCDKRVIRGSRLHSQQISTEPGASPVPIRATGILHLTEWGYLAWIWLSSVLMGYRHCARCLDVLRAARYEALTWTFSIIWDAPHILRVFCASIIPIVLYHGMAILDSSREAHFDKFYDKGGI